MSGKDRAEVWGRPAALAVAKDGSLLIADYVTCSWTMRTQRAVPPLRKAEITSI